MEGETGKFFSGICEEVCTREPDDSGVFDYDLETPNGEHLKIRNRNT